MIIPDNLRSYKKNAILTNRIPFTLLTFYTYFEFELFLD